MTEATGFEAKTIHCLLEVDPETGGFRAAATTRSPAILVIDETSMVDVMLMQALLQAVPDHAALLIVGDIANSPPSDRVRSWTTSSHPAPFRSPASARRSERRRRAGSSRAHTASIEA